MTYASLRLSELGGKKRQPNRTPERDVVNVTLEYLAYHPKVAWAKRMNTGALKVQARFIRFGFVGCADIIGQLKDGRFLAIECKSSEGRITVAQQQFLELVKRSNGVACVARRLEDVILMLEGA